jgi:hypothetical protein
MLVNPQNYKKKNKEATLNKQHYSFSMVRAGMLDGNKSVVVAEFYGNENTSASKKLFNLKFGNNICLDDSTKGSLVSEDKGLGFKLALNKTGSISWELKVKTLIDYHFKYGNNSIARFFNISDRYWDISGLKSQVSGYITVNNREFTIQNNSSYGYQDKIWGKCLNSSWFKLYSGKLSYDNDEEITDGAILVARNTIKVKRRTLGYRYFINIRFADKNYDFTSILHENMFYNFYNKTEDGFRLITIEADKTKQRIVVNLKVSEDSLVALNYPNSQNDNIPYLMSNKTKGTIEIFKSDLALNWQIEAQIKITEAAIQISNNDTNISNDK